MAELLRAAESGPAPVTTTAVRSAAGVFTLSVVDKTAPPPSQIAINQIDGFAVASAGYLTATCSPVTVTFTRPKGTDLDIVLAITELGFHKSGASFKSDAFLAVAKHPNRAKVAFRASNTSTDLIEVTLKFPQGISDSLLGILPGLRQPAITIAFASAGSIPASESNVYFDAEVTVAGHGYRPA
jgi:hypothetical protein